MVPLVYSFRPLRHKSRGEVPSSSRLLMLYLLDTVHAQDCSGACLRRKLYTSKGISAKRARIYIYLYYVRNGSLSRARVCGAQPCEFRVCACAVIDERVTGVCGLCACLCRVAVAGSRPIIVQREITPLIISPSLSHGLGASESRDVGENLAPHL